MLVISELRKRYLSLPPTWQDVNLRIKEALLIAKLTHRINSRLELNTEYIIN